MIATILLTISSLFSAAPALDSIRTEVIDGKTYIIHRVEPKETLFSISRKYGVALITVVESNPNASSGLDVGQLIKVPYSPNNRTKTSEGTIHRVGQKETLYSIAKQYGVTIDDIKEWNKLTGTGLNLGQELLIKNKTPGKKEVPSENRVTETKSAVTENKTSTNVIQATEAVVGSDEVREKGMALLLEGTEGNRKYLAHHRTVKPGTIIRVKNNATQKEVFVRVIGTLDNTEASDVVLRISKSAVDKLGGVGSFPVEITYFK